MVISDLNILCVGQLKQSNIFIPGTNIIVNDRNNKKICIYRDKYQDMQSLDGFWYQIEPNSIFELNYKKEFFDLRCENENQFVVFTDKEMKTTLIKIIKDLLISSPAGRVCLLVNFQGPEREVITLDILTLCKNIYTEGLQFNVVYDIRNNTGDGSTQGDGSIVLNKTGDGSLS